ncbi:MAG: hypothetical protein WBZ20_19020 [Nitrososphaeraceae archaeon]
MKNTLSASTTITTTKSMTVISISSAILLVGALAATMVVEQSYALKIMPPGHHTAAYIAGYKMGCTDGPDQENFVGSGGVTHHTRAFVLGYNYAFGHGCP